MLSGNQVINNMRTGIIRWLDIKEKNILMVMTGDDSSYLEDTRRAIKDYLDRNVSSGHKVDTVTIDELINRSFELYHKEYNEDFNEVKSENKYISNRYDYIFMIGVMEFCENPAPLVKSVYSMLTPATGKLYLGLVNRFGIKYFIGDHDPYTGRSFDGIENYVNLFESDKDIIKGHAYDKYTAQQILKDAGITEENVSWYSVFSGLDYPQFLFREDYLPNEELGIRYFPFYQHSSSIFMQEQHLLNPMARNGMFHQHANAYLVECTCSSENKSDVLHVTLSLDRDEVNAMATIIHGENHEPKIVEKRPMFEAGLKQIEKLKANSDELSKRGIHVIDSRVENGSYFMDYCSSESAASYFQRLIKEDKNLFVEALDRFRDLILKSSDIVKLAPEECVFGHRLGDNKEIRCSDPGEILAHAYVDMVPLNAFVINDEFYFYDQEFVEDNMPAKYIMWRTIGLIYGAGNGRWMKNIVPIEAMYERYGILEELHRYEDMGEVFSTKLRNLETTVDFHKTNGISFSETSTNRERISFSKNEYKETFVELFKGMEGKKVFLFGSGNYTKQFVSLFKNTVSISGILDNNPEKWGENLNDILISGVDALTKLDPEEYKVIICIKHYSGVLQQLKRTGVRNIGIYDPNSDYEMPEKMRTIVEVPEVKADSAEKKKYHIGYIAGVFDLYHIGHLNMFRRAKEQCDYLIVGIVSDEGVRRNKHTDPFIPFEERKQLVETCQYVDRAVEIPLYAGGSMDAWRLYHFDVQFSGSDYEKDPAWIAKKKELEEHGATIVFFPYTESTNSTYIKKMISEKMI